MRGWRGGSTATTIALTVVVAMVVGFSLQEVVGSGLHYLGLPRRQTVQQGDAWLFQQLPGRIAGLLDVLDATPDAERPAVIAAAQRPRVHVRVLDAPIPNWTDKADANAALLRRRIEAALRVPRPVIVTDRYSPVDKQADPAADRVESGVLIEAALSDGRWLLFRSDLHAPPPVDPVASRFSQARFAASLALSILLGIVLSMLAARRLARPLTELTAAVDQPAAAAMRRRFPREDRGRCEGRSKPSTACRRGCAVSTKIAPA